MEALDGNAIAGPLFEHFGREMTATVGSCRHCGTRSRIAELAVYVRAPGVVARCRACGREVIVMTDIRGVTTAHIGAFSLPA